MSLLIAVVVAAELAAFGVSLIWMKRPRILRARLRERVIVTLKSGDAFDGLLYAEDPQSVCLRQASALGGARSSPVLPIDGEILILIADIAYIQRP